MADRFRRERKEKEWQGLPSIAVALTGDSTNLGGRLDFASRTTVIRMLGEYTISPSAATVAGDNAFVTMALGKVSTDAAVVGAGSVPDPASEAGYPWLYWVDHPFQYTIATDLNESSVHAVRHRFDVRTMRKFSPGESLTWVIEYTNSGGNPPLEVNVGITRVLLALS